MARGQMVGTGHHSGTMECLQGVAHFADGTSLQVALAPNATVEDVLRDRDDSRLGMAYTWEGQGLARL